MTVARTHLMAMSHQGPIPDPDTLAGYARINPDLPNQIFQAAERQAAHRQSQDEIALKAHVGLSFRGQSYGFVVALAGLCIGGGVAIVQPIAGTAIAGATLLGIVATFVTGKRQESRPEPDSKPPKLAP